MTAVPAWLTNYFTIHVIIEMVDRATDKVLKIYPQSMMSPSITPQDDQKDLKLRKEAYQVLKVFLDSDYIENQELKNDAVYNEWSSKVRLAEGLYNLILNDIKYIMTESHYTAPALLQPRFITHLWASHNRDILEANGAYPIEYPLDSVDLHPIYKSIKIRLEKQEKYSQYITDYTKLSTFTSSLLEKSKAEGSTAALAYLKTQYGVDLS